MPILNVARGQDAFPFKPSSTEIVEEPYSSACGSHIGDGLTDIVVGEFVVEGLALNHELMIYPQVHVHQPNVRVLSIDLDRLLDLDRQACCSDQFREVCLVYPFAVPRFELTLYLHCEAVDLEREIIEVCRN
ncbi:MAG TPA: hypothetical protein PLC98_20330 [Anaerolineales bacterium]|nr:hypothetical protein [Anaerolineales bacterium]